MIPRTTTESSIASVTSTTVGSTTASSFVDTTTVAASSTLTSDEESSTIVTESISSAETSLDPEETSTTALSTTEATTTEIATTTEAATTTDTTTTSEAPSAVPFLSNAGFDDYASSLAPWELQTGENTVSIASDVKHDGRNSALMVQGMRGTVDYIRQPLRGSITAGVAYTMSAWVKADMFCPGVALICTYQTNNFDDPEGILLTSHVDEWTHVSSTCTYTQEQVDSGEYFDLVLLLFDKMVDHKEILRPKYSFDDIPSLAGKVALVTGANTPDGVGYHIAHQLALKGAKVYIGTRNLQKATKAIRTMLAESPELKPESLVPFAVDMGNFKQVQFAARKVVAEEPRLDILVNNAAVLARPLDKDGNGISVSFGINHLGPFLLTRELLPLLNKTQAEHPGVRIVNVASTAHYDVPTGAKFGSLEDFNTTYGSEDESSANYLRYGYSKLASILHTKELQRRFDQQGIDILALSVHPGGVATNGAAGYLGGRDNDIFRSNLSPFEGAITPLFAAAHPEPARQRDKYAGSFIMPFGGLKEPTEDANNVELAKQLWTTSEKVDYVIMRTWFGRGKKLQRAVTSCCLCAFVLYGYDQGVFGGILENEDWMRQFNDPGDTLTGFITSSYNLGCLLGCFKNFFVGEKLGRRWTIWVAMGWILVGAALQATAFTRGHLIVGRVVTGFGTGLKTSTVPMYQSELCEGTKRGRLVSAEVMFVGIGIAFAYWWDFAFSFVGGPFAWRWPLAFQAVFAFWVIFVVFGVPESPRWLLNHGKRQEAVEVLSAVYDKSIDHPDIQREVQSIEAALSMEAEAEGSASWASTFRKDKVSTRYRVFLAWFVQFMNQAGGINLVVYYILTVLTANVGLEHRLAQIIAGCIQLMFPIGSLLPTLALDKMGRRSTMMWGSAGLSFSMMMVAALLSQADDTSRGRAFAAGSVAFFFTYMLVFGASMNCVPWVYVPEILPLHARTKGTAIGVSSNWLWNFTVVMITPILINRLQWKAYLIFMATNLIFVPIIFFLYPETSNLALEEVDYIFARGENTVQVAREMQKELALHGRLADDRYPENATKVENI
ncbi:sugar transporter STL1 [Fusarium tjaetaba]|uniref:Sugar transporter STL1 n=1 Tax=Fusarium tjaetaba TaxID=1567544 RepID=A0A8H5RIW6_9HYPO|nr:sugar transporter STL1 [Fusarium tjaetaba]KAF5633938.1 sugar transporter STL1 [Fusarium tjaetaba]